MPASDTTLSDEWREEMGALRAIYGADLTVFGTSHLKVLCDDGRTVLDLRLPSSGAYPAVPPLLAMQYVSETLPVLSHAQHPQTCSSVDVIISCTCRCFAAPLNLRHQWQSRGKWPGDGTVEDKSYCSMHHLQSPLCKAGCVNDPAAGVQGFPGVCCLVPPSSFQGWQTAWCRAQCAMILSWLLRPSSDRPPRRMCHRCMWQLQKARSLSKTPALASMQNRQAARHLHQCRGHRAPGKGMPTLQGDTRNGRRILGPLSPVP